MFPCDGNEISVLIMHQNKKASAGTWKVGGTADQLLLVQVVASCVYEGWGYTAEGMYLGLNVSLSLCLVLWNPISTPACCVYWGQFYFSPCHYWATKSTGCSLLVPASRCVNLVVYFRNGSTENTTICLAWLTFEWQLIQTSTSPGEQTDWYMDRTGLEDYGARCNLMWHLMQEPVSTVLSKSAGQPEMFPNHSGGLGV